MKRILAFIIAFVLIFTNGMTTLETQAEGERKAETVQPVEMTYINPLYEETVSEEDLEDPGIMMLADEIEYHETVAEAGMDIRDNVINREGTIQVGIVLRSTESSYVKQIMADVFDTALEHTGVSTEGDYLRWQYGGWKCDGNAWYYTGETIYYWTFTYTVTYYTTPEQEAVMTQEVDELLDELNLDGLSDYEKVKKIYNWVCANVTYDHANLKDDTYKLKHTAYAALIDGTAVCQGYAALVYRLMLEEGIDTRLISGTGAGGPHGWNIVELKDFYYNVDSTWDAGFAEEDYSFFLKNTENFYDHQRDAEYETAEFHSQYPMGEEDYVEITGPAIVAEGKSGDTQWTLTEDGVLTISGEGPMVRCNNGGAPWEEYSKQIVSVVIEDKITTISDSAFYYYQALESVTIGETVTSIGTTAFGSCYNLKQVSIPKNISYIAKDAFEYCAGLNAFYVDSSNQYYSSDERGVLFDKDQTNLIQAPGLLAGEYYIPDSVITVRDNAFNNCDQLTDIYFGEKLQVIGESAFDNCNNLKMFNVDASNQYYSSDDKGILFNKEQSELLQAPVSIAGSYIIPDSVLSIKGRAFYECDLLTDISGGKNLTTIGWNAFAYCDNLYSVTLSDSVKSLDYYSFAWCKNLTKVHLGNGLTVIADSAFRECSELTDINIPDGVQIIEHAAFSDCTSLQEIDIPKSVSSIEQHAFASCSSLSTVRFMGDAPQISSQCFMNTKIYAYYPDNNATWTSEVMQNYGGTITWVKDKNVEKIASGWSGYTQWELTSDGVLTFYGTGNMKNYAYSDARPWDAYSEQIQSVVVEEGVTAIGECAFKGLTKLESATLPTTGLTKIGEAAFYGCESLEKIVIPEGIYTIWAYTFKGCTSLESVKLPKTLIKIDQGAFENCTSLPYIFMPTNIEIIGSWSFKGCTGLSEADMQWTDATKIRKGAFKNCSSLTDILLPSDIQVLGDSCFYGIGATSFTVPKTVTSVEPWCFARANVKEITFEGDAPTIGEGAFNKISLTAYYPGGNSTWKSGVMQNYGGNISWIAK